MARTRISLQDVYMRVLALPGNNALSHVAKCLSLGQSLAALGHELVLAVTESRRSFVERLGFSCEVISDLQESDQGAGPSFTWFKRPDRIVQVVEEEARLIEAVVPDRVIGVFRFTARLSSSLCQVPFDSLSCGCMTTACSDVLGFTSADPGRAEQDVYLKFFWAHAASGLEAAAHRLGLPTLGATDGRAYLEAERTYLWDVPEFEPIAPRSGLIHIGPPTFNGWPCESAREFLETTNGPLAVVTLGTGLVPDRVAERIATTLACGGYTVAVAGGGQSPLPSGVADGHSIRYFDFAPMDELLDRASLLVCHGGQQTVFEGISHLVPVAVLPFQPEQAHNGLRLEQLDAGGRVVGPAIFRGSPHVYLEEFFDLPVDDLFSKLESIAAKQGSDGLQRLKAALDSRKGMEELAGLLDAQAGDRV